MILRDLGLIAVGLALAGSVYAWWLFFKVTKIKQIGPPDILIMKTHVNKIGLVLELDRDLIAIYERGREPSEIKAGETKITLNLDVKDEKGEPFNEVAITDLFQNLVEDMKLAGIPSMDMSADEFLRTVRPIEIVLREVI